jgi:DNA-binding MarR family transcriptional regulator
MSVPAGRCDIDLLLFFFRHPRTLLTSDRLAAYVGYDLNQIARSLDKLIESGLVERSRNPTYATRLYCLKTDAFQYEWLSWLCEIGSTREGRLELIEALAQHPAGRPGTEHQRGTSGSRGGR